MKTTNNLIHEVITRLAFTRSRDGRVLKAILKVPTGENSKNEPNNTETGFLKKLFGKGKDEDNENDY